MGLMASVVAVGFVIVSLENVPLLLILSYCADHTCTDAS